MSVSTVPFLVQIDCEILYLQKCPLTCKALSLELIFIICLIGFPICFLSLPSSFSRDSMPCSGCTLHGVNLN